MKLLKKENQFRRNFDGVYECEGCGHIRTVYRCYDDRNFHDNIMPNKKCDICGKSTNDLGVEKEHVSTKYPDCWQV
jgi:hypothetical protein